MWVIIYIISPCAPRVGVISSILDTVLDSVMGLPKVTR